MKVAVVTPTIASEHLKRCLDSVSKQTYDDITHYVFVDGKDYHIDVQIETLVHNKVKTVILEENVGKGWYGHRVYAACSFLVNADIICYLDEDNWIEPNHIETLIDVIKRGNDWAYSLRNIHDKDGTFLCEDNCESLGKWPVYFNDDTYHIDTSCFAVKRDVAVRVGHSWYGQWGADRQFFYTLKKHFPKFDCNRLHTLNYRLDGNENSVKHDFFIEGNKVTEQKYSNGYPWTQKVQGIEREIGPGIVLVE
jgi:glycosyltransferase involved in cell wall biosynthesis